MTSLKEYECYDCAGVLEDPHTGEPAQKGELGYDQCAGCQEPICYDCRIPTGYGEHACESCHDRAVKHGAAI